MAVTTRREESIFFVELDNSPDNVIDLSVRKGLNNALQQIKKQKGLTRVILTGRGDVFSTRTRRKDLYSRPAAPHLRRLISQIETSEIPWIAAINGSATGSGCELILGCRYRIAVADSEFGFPDIEHYLIPEAGGTQRLPRLVGLERAVKMIASGKPISSSEALSCGLIDQLILDGNAVETAIELSESALDNVSRVADRSVEKIPDSPILLMLASSKNANLKQTTCRKIEKLVFASATVAFDEGLTLERNAALAVRNSAPARSLQNLYFAERTAKATEFQQQSVPINHVVVVGGGTMGSGIAYALLKSGIPKTTIIESNSDAANKVIERFEKIIMSSQKRQLIGKSHAKKIRSNLELSTDYSSASDASLAIEAVFEDMQVKKSVFSNLEAHVPSSAILATNTSYLDVNEIASDLKDPSRLVGLHFFAPAHIMKLLEVVRGKATSDQALATGYNLADRLQKIPVLAGVCDGFIGNRILSRYREAADTLLMEGILPSKIDQVMVRFGYRMGPYQAQDLSGLDIAYANRRRQDATRDPQRLYVSVADQLVERGRLGRKTNRGWYCYTETGNPFLDIEIKSLLLMESERLGFHHRYFSYDEIRTRLLLAMINEAADILYEGIAQSAQDIDLVTVYGYGFPRWRGGLMHYADSRGVSWIIKQLERLQREDPLVWNPSPALRYCAENNLSLAEYRANKD